VLNDFVLSSFSENGIVITDIYFCPSLDDDHPQRKPNPGMFVKAQKEHSIDMARSVAVGDKETDNTAAIRAGVATTVLNRPESNGKTDTKAGCVVDDLMKIVDIAGKEGMLCS
jgi:HAD superfamily hydrolase (TIGR01662 family)